MSRLWDAGEVLGDSPIAVDLADAVDCPLGRGGFRTSSFSLNRTREMSSRGSEASGVEVAPVYFAGCFNALRRSVRRMVEGGVGGVGGIVAMTISSPDMSLR